MNFIPASSAMPFTRSTADITPPFSPVFCVKPASAGFVPSPHSHRLFAGFLPSAMRLLFTGWSLSSS